MEKDKSNIIQLIIAAIVVIGGMILLYVGVAYDPKGEIHETVLIAFGEAATFAGSIMGVDYHYKSKYRHDYHPTDTNTTQRKSGDGQNDSSLLTSSDVPKT